MSNRKSVRVAAKEAMQKLNYDPLEVLVMCAQEAADNLTKAKIAETLLPYMYPKLSNVTMDGEINVSQNAVSQAALLRRVLADPDLADAAQKLSVAAAMCSLESEGEDQVVQ